MLLEGKTAIVTGTGPNIGGEIARTLARNRAKVVCLDVKEDQAKITADQIEKAGGTAYSAPDRAWSRRPSDGVDGRCPPASACQGVIAALSP